MSRSARTAALNNNLPAASSPHSTVCIWNVGEGREAAMLPERPEPADARESLLSSHKTLIHHPSCNRYEYFLLLVAIWCSVSYIPSIFLLFPSLLLRITTVLELVLELWCPLHNFVILHCTYINCCLSVNCAGQECTLIHMVLFFRFTAESWIKF